MIQKIIQWIGRIIALIVALFKTIHETKPVEKGYGSGNYGGNVYVSEEKPLLQPKENRLS